MKTWHAHWARLQALIQQLMQTMALKLRGLSLSQRQRQRNDRAWWQKDIKELWAYLQQRPGRGSSGISWQSISDVSQWSVRFRMGVLAVVYGTVLTVGGSALWSGTQSSIAMLDQDLRELQSRYLSIAKQVDLLPVYQSQNAQILEQFGTLLDAIPAALESVHVLTQINQAAKEAGLHLELFKPLSEEAQPYYVVLPVEIRLRGDYNAMARFLELVSKMKHLVTVDIVLIPSATHEKQIVLVSLLKAYRYRELPAQHMGKAAR